MTQHQIWKPLRSALATSTSKRRQKGSFKRSSTADLFAHGLLLGDIQVLEGVQVQQHVQTEGGKFITFHDAQNPEEAMGLKELNALATIDEEEKGEDIESLEGMNVEGFTPLDDWVNPDALSDPTSDGEEDHINENKVLSKKLKLAVKKVAAKSKDAQGELEEDGEVPTPPTTNIPYTDDELRSSMVEWSEFPLHQRLLASLKDSNFTSPTPIQMKTLPFTLSTPRDVIASAETGSGKTLAFGLPILNSILNEKENSSDSSAQPDQYGCHALILLPTRELAIQVNQHLQEAAKYARIKIRAMFGGVSILKHQRYIERQPHVIIATPGRLWELIQEVPGFAEQLRAIRFLVFDEADRMLEDGHFKELDSILAAISVSSDSTSESGLPSLRRQTFVFSATMNAKLNLNLTKKKRNSDNTIENLLSKIQFQTTKNPIRINANPKTTLTSRLLETKIECVKEDKDIYLYYILLTYPGKTLVFVNSIDALRRLVPIFNLLKLTTHGIHAEMPQKERFKSLEAFRAASQAVLICSDVAARGIDVPNVDHVIHYQTPRSADLYVHRSGRTARAGKDGVSILFVAPDESILYKKLCSILSKPDGIADFPLDRSIMTALRERVRLAQTVEKAQHRHKKRKKEQGWFKRAASEMDIDLDSDLADSDSDDDGGSNTKKGRGGEEDVTLRKQVDRLEAMLNQKIISKGISGRYLTGNANTELASILLERQQQEAKSEMSPDEEAGLIKSSASTSSMLILPKRPASALSDILVGRRGKKVKLPQTMSLNQGENSTLVDKSNSS